MGIVRGKEMIKKLLILFVCLVGLSGCSIDLLNFGVKPVEVNDEYPPYININKYEYITTIGKPVDFSNITAYDDIDGVCQVEMQGYVNYNKAGEYYPVLIARDTSENKTSVTVTVIVLDHIEEPEVTDGGVSEEETIVEETTCDKANAKDKNYPCSVVIPSEASLYSVLFMGNDANEKCVGSEEEPYTCQAVYTNDNTLWGYGRVKE